MRMGELSGIVQHFQGGFGDKVGFDASHAAVVDGAFAEETGAAFDRMSNDAREGAGGTGGLIVSGTENSNGGDTEGRADVHSTGIVGEDETAGGEDFDEGGEGGFSGEVDGFDFGVGDSGANLFADFEFGLGAQDQGSGAGFASDLDGGFGEAFGKPAFCGAISGSGADSDGGWGFDEGLETFPAGAGSFFCAGELDGRGAVVGGDEVGPF